MLKILVIIILILAVFYLILAWLLFLYQENMIFHSTGKIVGTPADRGLEFEELNFQSRDGSPLTGWFVPAENAQHTVLFCHGDGGNISHRLDTVSLFHSLPVNFFIFDYRTYGKSQGKLSEQALHEDVAAAWRYLTEFRKIAPHKIIIIGRSMGGALAARAAAEYSPGGLIMESSFTSLKEIARKKMPFLPLKYLLKYKLPTLSWLVKVKCPILIISSPDDNTIAFSHGEKLFAQSPEPKTFVELTGDHNDCYFLCRTKYLTALKIFLESCF